VPVQVISFVDVTGATLN